MKRRILPALLAGLALALPCGQARANILENEGRQILAGIFTNPGQFVFDFQKDMETLTPLPPGKWVGLNWHIGQFLILPVPDPASINLSGKLRVHPEGSLAPGLPQLDLIGGFWTLGPVIDKIITDKPNADGQADLIDGSFSGFYTGAVLTTTVQPRIRIFGGWKYSQMKAELTLDEPQDILGTSITSFKTGFRDHFLFAGIQHPTAVDRWWNAQVFYGLSTADFGAKISWYKKMFEIGFNIYPESTLIIHPVVNFHLNFG